MSWLQALAGLGLGALGGALHLSLVAARARLCLRGRLALAWLAYPLGLALVAAAVYAAARLAPVAAWFSVLGLAAVRGVVLAWSSSRRAGAER